MGLIEHIICSIGGNIIPVYFESVKNGNWDNPSTWLGNVVPTSGANITIKHNVIGNVNTTCNSLRVQSPEV
jgi:hypothetical protein